MECSSSTSRIRGELSPVFEPPEAMHESVIAGRRDARSARCRRDPMDLVDFRLYRIALLPALLAVIVAMFSLEGAPNALEPLTPPTTFEGDRAAALGRQIAAT